MKKQILVSIYKLALFLRRVIVTVHSVLSNTLRDAQNYADRINSRGMSRVSVTFAHKKHLAGHYR